jgi:glycolate oxidase FAD binding subunit
LTKAFEALLGSRHVQETRGEHLDGVPIRCEVRPGTPEEVAACLRIAGEERQALFACGGATKLDCGNVVDSSELLRLSLARLDQPFELQPDEGIATLGAGVSLARLRDQVAAHGKWTLLDTPHPNATVGGTVATDAFSALLSADRRLRNDLLGIRVALPGGTLARAGGRVVKNVTGFDLVRLHCGAYGTLGVITEVTVRLRPVPETNCVLARPASSVIEAFHMAGMLVESRAEPAGAAIRPTETGLLVSWVLEGSEADVRVRAERFRGEGADSSVWSEVQAALVSIPPDGAARVRLLGRTSDVAAMWRWLEEAGGKPIVALPLVGIVVGDRPEDRVLDRVGAARESGKTVVIERASPTIKGRIDVFGPVPDSVPLIRALKARFDPQRLLSPGRALGRP